MARKQLQLLIIILQDHSSEPYGKIKRICETELGIISQCCQASYAADASNQYLENVALKINVKVVASMDWLEVTNYRGLVSAQTHRNEIIMDPYKEVHDPHGSIVHGGMISLSRCLLSLDAAPVEEMVYCGKVFDKIFKLGWIARSVSCLKKIDGPLFILVNEEILAGLKESIDNDVKLLMERWLQEGVEVEKSQGERGTGGLRNNNSARAMSV
ncbi:hypothetical protein Ancab_007668 [Ancistrocladus abbreviatus]